MSSGNVVHRTSSGRHGRLLGAAVRWRQPYSASTITIAALVVFAPRLSTDCNAPFVV